MGLLALVLIFGTYITLSLLRHQNRKSGTSSRSVGLRKGDHKTKAVLYDIADDIGKNYTLNHLIERVKLYNEENFNYEFIDVRIRE